jgi:2',3'-cyclic-nucleotide 2'-phosphodiesterase
MVMRILCIGDIMGEPGRKAVRHLLTSFIEKEKVDFVVANGENAAGGFGLTESTAREIFAAGVDVITGGNHTWDKKEIADLMQHEPRVLRPGNYPAGAPGKGHYVGRDRKDRPVGVVNLMGRVFMQPLDNPFPMALELLRELRRDTKVLVVDFHADASSEKQAMGWHVNGHCSLVFGTHTHVQTADERILSGGTAFITDAGLTGPLDSVIGMKKELALERFLTGMPTRLEVAKKDVKLQGVLVDVDETDGRATAIQRIQLPYVPK